MSAAYRTAPDTLEAIRADLGALGGGSVARDFRTGGPDMGIPMTAEAGIPAAGTEAATAPRSTGHRLALFGAAAALLAPLAPRSAAARVADSDVTLIGLGAELNRTLDGAAFAFDPVADEDDQDRRIARANALQLEITALPAVGLAGVLAKAKAYLDSNSYDTVNLAELADSLAEDAERIIGEFV